MARLLLGFDMRAVRSRSRPQGAKTGRTPPDDARHAACAALFRGRRGGSGSKRALLAAHVLDGAAQYARWQPGDDASVVIEHLGDEADVTHSRVYRVLTPEQTVALARESGALIFHPLVGGLDPDVGWRSLQLFADEVAPKLLAED